MDEPSALFLGKLQTGKLKTPFFGLQTVKEVTVVDDSTYWAQGTGPFSAVTERGKLLVKSMLSSLPRDLPLFQTQHCTTVMH